MLTTLPVTGEEMSGELSADEQSVLDALADAFAGAVAADPGTPVDVTESWWAPDCATVAEQLDLPTLLGSTAVEEVSRSTEAGTSPGTSPRRQERSPPATGMRTATRAR